MKKYTFVEFIAALESDDFDNPTEHNLKWADSFVDSMPEILKTGQHVGDCTEMPITCPICTLESMLNDYCLYSIHEKFFRQGRV